MLCEWPGQRTYSCPGRVAVVGIGSPGKRLGRDRVAPERFHDVVHQWPHVVAGQAVLTLKRCTEGVQRRPVQPKPSRLFRIIPRRQQHRLGLPGRVRAVPGRDAMVAHAEGFHDERSVGDPPSQPLRGRRVVDERPHSFGICPPGRRLRLVPRRWATLGCAGAIGGVDAGTAVVARRPVAAGFRRVVAAGQRGRSPPMHPRGSVGAAVAAAPWRCRSAFSHSGRCRV